MAQSQRYFGTLFPGGSVEVCKATSTSSLLAMPTCPWAQRAMVCARWSAGLPHPWLMTGAPPGSPTFRPVEKGSFQY